MNKIILILLGLTMFMSLHAEAMSEKQNNKEVVVSGKLMKAYDVALKDFLKTGPDLDNFLIKFADHGDWIEVAFIPIPTQADKGRRGGRNSSGREVHYAISTVDLLLQRTWFGR